MTQTETLFLNLLRSGMLNTRFDHVCGEFGSIEFLATTHICLPLVYQGAVNCGISLREERKNSVLKIILRNENNLRVQKQVLDRLEAAGIPCAVIKGSSAAVHYALPYLRPLGDVDILVRACDYNRTTAVFAAELADSETQSHDFHYQFTVDGFRIEIHKGIRAFGNDDYGKRCSQIMEHALDCVEYAVYENFRFPVLSKKYQALCLLFHMQRHLSENKLTMRMLCDWAVFISNVSKEEWEQDVKQDVERLSLKKFSDALTCLCDRYLGTDNADKIEETFESDFYDDFIEEFLAGGVISNNGIQTSKNFGNLYSRNLLKTNNKFSALFNTLNEIARENFKIAKYPCFLPFFWCYLPIRYLFRQATGKRGRLSYQNAVHSAEHWKKLYETLEFRNL